MVSPWNFPLNLVAHKVAPAIAVGCPFVLKPASRTPISALILGDILSRIEELPKGAFSVLPVSREEADMFTVDERFKLLTFTGSGPVGWGMKARAGKKKVRPCSSIRCMFQSCTYFFHVDLTFPFLSKQVVMELGGNAPCIVDDYVPDLDYTISRLINGGFYQGGQSCIHMQRLYVHERLYDEVRLELSIRYFVYFFNNCTSIKKSILHLKPSLFRSRRLSLRQ